MWCFPSSVHTLAALSLGASNSVFPSRCTHAQTHSWGDRCLDPVLKIGQIYWFHLITSLTLGCILLCKPGCTVRIVRLLAVSLLIFFRKHNCVLVSGTAELSTDVHDQRLSFPIEQSGGHEARDFGSMFCESHVSESTG